MTISRYALATLCLLNLVGCRPGGPDPVAQGGSPSSVSPSPLAAASSAAAGFGSPSPSPAIAEINFDYAAWLEDTGYDRLTEEHQFQRIPQGESLGHTFPITNDGPEVMVLGPPQSTFPCCVNLSLESERVDPGDSVLLNVSFDSTHRPGSFFANIVVPVVSGSDKEAFFFRLTGDVTETIVLDPEVLFLEPGKSGKFLVKSERYKTGLKIEKVESQVSSVTIVPGPVEGTTQSFEVKVSGSGEGLPTTLRLVTNDKEIPDMLIAVTLSAPAPHSH